MTDNLDTNSWEYQQLCLERHKHRVADLKKALTQKDRVAIFERIIAEVNYDEARSCWKEAFERKEEHKPKKR